jgi:hypothetical protein
VQQHLWKIAAGGIALVIGIYLLIASNSQESAPTIEQLAETASHGEDQTRRESATFQLADRGQVALPHLRRLVREGNSPEVRAAATYAVARQYDYKSMDALLDSMEDESVVVRGRAGRAVVKLLGRDRRFRASGSAEERARIIGHCRADWETIKASPHFESFKRKLRNHED